MTLLDTFAPKRGRTKIDPQLVPPVALAPLPLPDVEDELTEAARKHLVALDDLRARCSAQAAELDRRSKLIDRLEAEVAILSETREALQRDRDATYTDLVAMRGKFKAVSLIMLDVLKDDQPTPVAVAETKPVLVEMRELETAITGHPNDSP